MISGSSHIYALFFVIFDFIAICLAWITSYAIRFHTHFESPLGIPNPKLYLKLIPFILVIWTLITIFSGIYKKIGRYRSKINYLYDVCKSSIIFFLSLIAFTYFYEEYRYSRLTLLFFMALLPIYLFISRKAASLTSRIYQVRRKKKSLILIAAQQGLRDFIEDRSHLAEFYLLGVIIPEGTNHAADLKYCQDHNISVFHLNQNWVDFFSDHRCQSVVISLPHNQYQFLEDNLDEISDQVPDIKIIPDVLKYTRFNTAIDMMGSTPVIHIHESPLTGINCLLKRSIDIFGAILALAIFGPIMIVVSILIPLGSRGPILYRQTRMGLDGHTFACLKFRSMPTDAEAQTGAVWATAEDKRATPLGAFLRKTSIDELPQLINVLKGEMSLVGPRPERPVFVREFRKEVPGYMLRHKVKTGITGWAQVNGWRGSTSIEKRIECDLYYIQNWSVWLDFKIILMTIEEVFIGKNAY